MVTSERRLLLRKTMPARIRWVSEAAAVDDHDGALSVVRQCLDDSVDGLGAGLGFDGVEHQVTEEATRCIVLLGGTQGFKSQTGLADARRPDDAADAARLGQLLAQPSAQVGEAFVLDPERVVVLGATGPVAPGTERADGSGLGSLLSAKMATDGW